MGSKMHRDKLSSIRGSNAYWYFVYGHNQVNKAIGFWQCNIVVSLPFQYLGSGKILTSTKSCSFQMVIDVGMDLREVWRYRVTKWHAFKFYIQRYYVAYYISLYLYSEKFYISLENFSFPRSSSDVVWRMSLLM